MCPFKERGKKICICVCVCVCARVCVRTEQANWNNLYISENGSKFSSLNLRHITSLSQMESFEAANQIKYDGGERLKM